MAENKASRGFFGTLKAHLPDIILILSLLVFSGLLILMFSLFRPLGDRVTVEVEGVTVATYSLSADGEYEIGEGNRLVIEGGEAYISWADCPDHICIRTGRISRVGETVICLPNKVAVTVRGEGGPDLVS